MIDDGPKPEITIKNIIIGLITVSIIAFFFMNNMLENQATIFDTKIDSLKTKFDLSQEEIDTLQYSFEIELEEKETKIIALTLDLNEQEIELNSRKDEIKAIESELSDKFNSLTSTLVLYKSESSDGIGSLGEEIDDYKSESEDMINGSIDTMIEVIDSEFGNITNDIDNQLDIGFEERMDEINGNIDYLIDSLFLLQGKKITMPYVLNGYNFTLDLLVYKGFRDYLSNIRAIDSGGYNVSIYIIHEKQRLMLLPLVDEIKKITDDKDDQARIAISMVQHILYDYDLMYLFDVDVDDMYPNKFPYEVVYDQRGVCGCKSHLLTFLLKELGYGVVMFDFPSHRAVGIKCPIEYSYQNTGYCFIEATYPFMVTYTARELVNISFEYEGASFDSVSKEYDDAQEFTRLLELESPTEEDLDKYLAIWDKYRYNDYVVYNHVCGPDGEGMYCNDECWSLCPVGEEFICLPNWGGLCI